MMKIQKEIKESERVTRLFYLFSPHWMKYLVCSILLPHSILLFAVFYYNMVLVAGWLAYYWIGHMAPELATEYTELDKKS